MQRRNHRVVLSLVILSASAALAQSATKLDLPRPSPKGSVTQTVGLTDITVAFSSPGVKGRKIWGEVVPFDKVWRAGANECTKLTVSTPISIEGKPVAAGSYCVFLLPQKSGWTFILSKNLEQAGSDEYKQSEDALRIPATVSTIPLRERMAFTVIDFDDEKGTLAMEWETQRVAVKFTTGTQQKVMAQIHALKSDDWGQYNARPLPPQYRHRAGTRDAAGGSLHQAQGDVVQRLDQGPAPPCSGDGLRGACPGAEGADSGEGRGELLRSGRRRQGAGQLEEVVHFQPA